MAHPHLSPDNDTWQPQRPGMVKRQCAHCGLFFASDGGSSCATCVARRRNLPAETDTSRTGQIPARGKRHMK